MTYQKLTILGQMSGTSLDGLDLALCEFEKLGDKVNFKFLHAETISYPKDIKLKLDSMYDASANDFFAFHQFYGKHIADKINAFLVKTNLKADYLALHGHTVFHKPELHYTTQIGCPATVCAYTNINTISGFRNIDVALGGQGAPLVPIGDRDLFPEFESCLNIGGIANISFNQNNQRIAFDICLANILLNYLSSKVVKDYDEGGKIAQSGNINNDLLNQLLEIDYQKKSIGREEFENYFRPILDKNSCSIEDKLRTCVECIAICISQTFINNQIKSVLISGGGAYNHFLIDCLKRRYSGRIEIPNDTIIQFKEAIIFAYLGYLFIHREANCLKSVTGATKDNIGGNLHLASPIL